MKINLLIPACAVILGIVLTLPGTANAQAATTAPAPAAPGVATPTAAKPAKVAYAGTITAIDSSTVTVATADSSLALAITPTTKMAKDRVHAHLSDFAVGDKVTGHYSTDDYGTKSASSLYKKSAPAAAQ